jgi:hypothetical protein
MRKVFALALITLAAFAALAQPYVTPFRPRKPPGILYRGAGTVASATGTVGPGLPGGTSVGDLLIMLCSTSGQAITASGWTEVASSPQDLGIACPAAGCTRLTAFYRIAQTTNATTTSDSGDHQICRINGWIAETFNGTTPFAGSSGGTQTGTTSLSVPAGTAGVANSMVLIMATEDFDHAGSGTVEFSGWANADLTSITERTDNSTSLGDGGGIGSATGLKATAGAYAATTLTTANGTEHGEITLVIAPYVSSYAGPCSTQDLTNENNETNVTDYTMISAGQSFLPKVSGMMYGIAFEVHTISINQTINWCMSDDTGTLGCGNAMAAGSVALTSANDNSWVTLVFPVPVAVDGSRKYYLSMRSTETTGALIWATLTGDPDPNGSLFIGDTSGNWVSDVTGADADFRVYICSN